MNLKDYHTLIPETCKYIYMAKEILQIKLRTLKRFSGIMQVGPI